MRSADLFFARRKSNFNGGTTNGGRHDRLIKHFFCFISFFSWYQTSFFVFRDLPYSFEKIIINASVVIITIFSVPKNLIRGPWVRRHCDPSCLLHPAMGDDIVSVQTDYAQGLGCRLIPVSSQFEFVHFCWHTNDKINCFVLFPGQLKEVLRRV